MSWPSSSRLFLASSCVIMLPLCGQSIACHLKWLCGGLWRLSHPFWYILMTHPDVRVRLDKVSIWCHAAHHRTLTDCSSLTVYLCFKLGEICAHSVNPPSLSAYAVDWEPCSFFPLLSGVCAVWLRAVVLRRPGTQASNACDAETRAGWASQQCSLWTRWSAPTTSHCDHNTRSRWQTWFYIWKKHIWL